MEKQSSLQQDLASSLAFSYCWDSRKHRPIMRNYPWKYRLTLDDAPELIQRGADLKFTLPGSVDDCQFYRIPPIADPKHAARLWPLMEELIALAPDHNGFSSLHDGARRQAAGFRIFAEITSISHPMHQNFSLSENVEKMLPAIRYMQAHFGEKISRTFKAVCGISPRGYQMSQKTTGRQGSVRPAQGET